MNIAVDACIVISAMKVPSLTIVDDGDPWRCRQVVLEAETPRIIAAAWFEVCRFSNPSEHADLQRIGEHIFVERLDRAVVEAAVALQAKISGKPTVAACATCGRADGATPCPGCSRLMKFKNRFVDYLVVAAANRDPVVTTLYSTDPDVLGMAEHVRSSLAIKGPPSTSGPMFDRMKGDVAKAV